MGELSAPANLSSRFVVFDLRGRHRPAPERGGGPLASICGLPVLVRNALLCQRAGIDHAVILCEDEVRPAVERALARCPRLRLKLVWLSADAGLLDLEAQGAGELLYWPGALSFGRYLPRMATAPLLDNMPAAVPLEAGRPAEGPALVAVGALAGLPEVAGIESLITKLLVDGRAQCLPLDRPVQLILDGEDAKLSEAALLRSLRKDVDGAVAKFDRYISLAVSRQLMRLPIRPNHVTVMAGVLGIACGLLASLGGYLPMLLAALGFQLNSILDGIDGEIARAKLLESRLGQWLDTLADDSSNLSFSVGVCVGCYRTWGSPVYLGLAGVAAVGFLITAVLMYHYIITVAHSGDLNDFKMPWEEAAAAQRSSTRPGGLAGVLARLKFVVRRDTFVFLSTCFALIGQLRVMAWLFAAGATAVWVSIFGYRVLRSGR